MAKMSAHYIAKKFNFHGYLTLVEQYGSGHINDTYLVECNEKPRYILQRINDNVFKSIPNLMENVCNVTSFLRKKVIAAGGNPDRECLTPVMSLDGNAFYQDENGDYWRAFIFIEDAISYQTIDTPGQFYSSARAFGRFQNMLSDYPAASLYETIPDFHNTAVRYGNLEKAIEKNAAGVADEVAEEIAFARARKSDAPMLVNKIASGELPLRVTHNDTKLNNVMLDPVTYDPLAVIDLDTVMPGLSLYDFGDSIRFGSTHAAEDEQDLSKVYCDLSLFEEYVKGFLQECGSVLTDEEVKLLPFAAKLMTYECGLRFLTDYLDGDIYFKTHYPKQNLYRCRTQFKLVADMEEKAEEMARIVAKYAKK